MEISIFSILFALLTMMVSNDGEMIRRLGFWNSWTSRTWIPIISNACGAILVGLVTKHIGSVRKGFALIMGLFLSGFFQVRNGNGVSSEQIAGGLLAAVSLWMHSTFPP
jgi:solute carrier family 35 (UDP-sugar transporter), member A1/2/3